MKLRGASYFFVFVAFLFLFSLQAFGQSSNASVGGIVSDPSGAIIPGVSIKATNQATGILTTVISNDAGAYNFASLLPGLYKISAELPGFRTQTYSDVQLGNAAQVRLNFQMVVASVATAVEVTVAAQDLITSSSSSVGEVLPQQQIQDLPLVSNNVLDLVGVMAGVYMTNDAVFGAEQTNFAGVSARDVNVQRDGISINSQRWPNGLDSPTRMNPDLVGEIRLILAPVDAEMGRGNGQVQIQTRSGTNAYHGLAVWNVQNSALDANLWVNNRNQTPNASGQVEATQPPWRNLHEYNLAFGGPIKKNKTFFYALWDQQIITTRQSVYPTVLTDCARLGIFRYYDNIDNGSSRATVPTVNVDGSPRSPNGSPLRFLSVFGPLAANPTKNDCSDAQINTSTLVPTGATPADPNRTQIDKTGFITNTLNTMPRANAFDNPGNLVATTGFFATYAPDGLNTATHSWVRRNKGADNLFGVGQDNNRKQINVRIDHNISDRHKLNGSYSFEKDTSDDAALPTWPSAFYGQDLRQPQVLSAGFTSTLSPSLLNEARFGMSRTGANVYAAPDRPDIGDQVSALLPQVSGQALAINLNFQNMAFGYGIIPAVTYSSHDNSPRWVYADTLSWTRGKHAFKFGGEYRISSTKSTNGGSVQTGSNRPVANSGNTFGSPVTGIARSGLSGTTQGGNQNIAENLLTFLSGSLSGVSQTRFTNNTSGQWNDFGTEGIFKVRDIHQNEFGSFFKDDWKLSRDLTLNLGVRWDYYGVPWEKNGLTTALVGGGTALFGISGRSFTDWMKPGARADLMQLTYVGPNSPNPGGKIYDRDMNNFGPAVGFAWQVPWFGQGKTTVRGGYQIQYLGGGRGFVLDTALGNAPSNAAIANYIVPASDPYFDISKLTNNAVIPITPLYQPLDTIPLTDRSQLLNAFDPNFVAPYIQNLTLSVTRNLSSKMTLDLRYIGTLSRKMYSNLDLNSPNFLFNGLKEAFDAARRGGESTLLDQMFQGINVAGSGCSGVPFTPTCGPVGGPAVGGVPQTGAGHLRAFLTTQGNLANGNYSAIATTLNTLTVSCFNAGNASLPACTQVDSQGRSLASLSGSVLRNSGLFPENFIKTNPQTSTSVYETNLGHANYHAFQAQFALRPVAGISTQVTYTWSRNLGQVPNEGPNGTGALFTDPTQQAADYSLLPTHRAHTITNYGTFALPFGPQKLFFSNSSGFWARLAENWQASWVVNLASGSPGNPLAQSMLYALGVPDVVGPFNPKDFQYKWVEGQSQGNLFADDNGVPAFSKTTGIGADKDPQCVNPNIVATSLSGSCTLTAIKDSQGRVVLQTPLPGTRGTLGQNPFYNLGTWAADMAIQKRIQIAESKTVTVRMDATNIFNHPTPAIGGGFFAATAGAPDLNLQSTVPFGTLNSKTGSRRFQFKARLDF